MERCINYTDNWDAFEYKIYWAVNNLGLGGVEILVAGK